MNCYLLSLNPDADITKQWDFGLVKDLLEGKLWRTPDWIDLEFKSVDKLSKDDTAVVVIPARHHKDLEDQINKQLNKINKVVLFLMGDEEAEFDVSKIDHPSIHIWVQNPHIGVHDKYHKIGTGYPQHMRECLEDYQERVHNIFFAGQVTHQRRKELIDVLLDMQVHDKTIEIHATKGFTQGLNHKDYYKGMSTAKIAPAPSGAVIPDSFRLFEALETMCIPVADQKTPNGQTSEYWDWLFGEITPFPKVTDFNALRHITSELLDDYPRNLHHQTAWWIKYKRSLAYKLSEQLQDD